jgi:hypothetical protein
MGQESVVVHVNYKKKTAHATDRQAHASERSQSGANTVNPLRFVRNPWKKGGVNFFFCPGQHTRQ